MKNWSQPFNCPTYINSTYYSALPFICVESSLNWTFLKAGTTFIFIFVLIMWYIIGTWKYLHELMNGDRQYYSRLWSFTMPLPWVHWISLLWSPKCKWKLLSCVQLCDPHGSHGSSVPGRNTRVGCHALLQEIFPNQGSNPGLANCRQILYRLSREGNNDRHDPLPSRVLKD